jgi:hypothetical protein
MSGWPACAAVAITLVATTAGAQLPPRWITGATGKGLARWEEEAGKLAYRGGATFGWAVVPGTAARDGFVEARFRPVAGREDRAGGIVWRWQDADDYYVARANALEGNVVAYKVIKGRRTDLQPEGAAAGAYGMKASVASGAWHTLRVDFAGAEFTVTFDGSRLFTVRDQSLQGPGAVGVWSKADSVTEFDRFAWGEAK